MPSCHLCLAGDVRELPEYARLTRVTSDCKPWPAGGRLGVCSRCGGVQKVVDAQWEEEIARIYSDYTIYFQAGGAEQAVFLGDLAQPMTRSEWLVQQVIRQAALPASGRLLDIGCGNGAFLGAFSGIMPDWTLAGTELSDAMRAIVERIPRVEALYTGALEEIPGHFDVISLVHVLEHISRPLELLAAVSKKLAPGGTVFVQVPDAARNPFDLLIADHVSHFTRDTARALLESAGYSVFEAEQSWVVKEISMLATYGGVLTPRDPLPDVRDASRALDWLLSARAGAIAARVGATGPFGLFGSSIAATWLAHEVDCGIEFFVDEDPGRHGHRFMGRLVVGPNDVPPASVVYVGIGGGVGEQVARRLSRDVPSVRWISAPPLH